MNSLKIDQMNKEFHDNPLLTEDMNLILNPIKADGYNCSPTQRHDSQVKLLDTQGEKVRKRMTSYQNFRRKSSFQRGNN